MHNRTLGGTVYFYINFLEKALTKTWLLSMKSRGHSHASNVDNFSNNFDLGFPTCTDLPFIGSSKL